MTFSKSSLFAAVAAAISSSAFAADNNTASTVIVTATRTAQTIDASLASVTVITQQQIEQQQATDLRGLLTAISGIDMTNSGGSGKATSMFIRGTSSSHVLFLIDGIRIGSATTGTPAIQDIPLDQIERIEIVRGPRSSLYGADAIGGVIQIFTKKGHKGERGSIEAGYGSFTSNKLSASMSGSSDKLSYMVSGSQFSTEGINALSTSDKDLDGYSNSSLNTNLQYQLGKTAYINANFMQSKGINEYDDSFTTTNIKTTQYVQQVTGIKLFFPAASNWDMTLSTAQSVDKTDNYTGGAFKSKFDTTKTSALWQNDISISDSNLLTLGMDFVNDKVGSTTAYTETSRNNTAAFLQHQWTGESNDISVGLRTDNNQSYGINQTGNIAWGYNFSTATRMIASYGTAFKAPTFNQLYYPNYGIDTIRPEKSESMEIELRKKHSWGNASVSVYNTRLTDLIQASPLKNIDKANIRGIELRLTTRIAGWDTQLEYSRLDPRDLKTGKLLARRSQESWRINMDRNNGKWTAGISMVGQGYRYDDAANTASKRLDGYNLINLRLSYAISKKMTFKWKIENLMDVQYQTVQNYNQPGFSTWLSLAYQGF